MKKIWNLILVFTLAFLFSFCMNSYASDDNEIATDPLISITSSKYMREYTYGDTINTDDIRVVANYQSGKGKEVFDYEVTVYDDYIRVSYTENGITRTDRISLQMDYPPLTSITATKTKTKYKSGETVNTNDITVTAFYGSYSRKVTGFTATYDSTNKYVNIVYAEKGLTRNYQINISFLDVTSISATKTKTRYDISDTISYSDMKVTVYYSDGSSETTSDYTKSYDSSTNIITVTYKSNGKTFTDTIKLSVGYLSSITATKTKTSYLASETVSTSDITVTAYYSDGTSQKVTSGVTKTYNSTYKRVDVSYKEGNYTRTYNIPITIVTLNSISATKTKVKYKSSESISTSDISVTLKYSDGTTKKITSGFTSIVMRSDNKIKVDYVSEGKTYTTYIYLTSGDLSSISASKSKVSYKAGETVNTNDITVTAKYSDGTTQNLTSGFTATYDSSSNRVNVSYTDGGVTKTTYINISMGTLSSISASKSQTRYLQGENVNTNDITVTAVYSDGTRREITSGFSASYDSYYNRINVSYSEGTVTKTTTISISIVYITSISATKERTRYVRGEKVNTNDITLTVNYSDGTSQKIKSGFTATYVEPYSSYSTSSTVNISYTAGGYTKSTSITIKIVTLKSITATKTKTTYKETEKVDTKNITVQATYSDGTTEKVTDFDASYSSLYNRIEVSYKPGSDPAATYYIPINIIKLTTLKVTKETMNLRENAEVNLKDVKVFAVYSDSSQEELKKCDIKFNSSLFRVEATYTENDKNFVGYLTLNKVSQSSIEVIKKKVNYSSINNIDMKDITVNVVYTDGTKDENVKDFTTDLTKGTTTEYGSTSTYITVTYKGYSKTFKAIVKMKIDGQTYTQTESNIQDRVAECGIMTGTDKGFEGSKTLTRAEAATIIVRMLGIDDSIVNSNENKQIFRDCPAGYWANKYINTAANYGLVKGTGDNYYSPNNTVTLVEFSTMAIRALGAGTMVDSEGEWPNNYISFAKTNKLLDDNLDALNVATRIQTATIVVNTLDSKTYETDSNGKTKKTSTNYYDKYLKGKKVSDGSVKVSSLDYDATTQSLKYEFELIEYNKQQEIARKKAEEEARIRKEKEEKARQEREKQRAAIQTAINNNKFIASNIQKLLSISATAGRGDIGTATNDLNKALSYLTGFKTVSTISSSSGVVSALSNAKSHLNSNLNNIKAKINNDDKKLAIQKAVTDLVSDINAIDSAYSKYKDEARGAGFSVD